MPTPINGIFQFLANLNDLIGEMTGAWADATAYTAKDLVRPSGGDVYYCHTAHTSSSASEPGVGVDWEDFWFLFLEDGAQGAAGGVDASANIADNALVRGDGGAKNIQQTGISIDDDDSIYGFKAKFNNQTGTTYTLAASDTGKTVTCDNASAITVTLPNNLAVGFICEVIQLGTGQVSFSAASGATINNRSSQTKIAGRYGATRLVVRSNSGGTAAVYNLAGDTGV